MLARMLFETLHAAFHRPDTPVYRWTQGVVWVLIAASIGLVVVDVYEVNLPDWVVWIDRTILGLFALEISLRILTFRPPLLEVFEDRTSVRLKEHLYARFVYALRPLNLIDILTVVAVFPALRGLRALRLLRLLRANRFSHGSFRSLARALEDNAALFLIALSTLFTAVGIGGMSIWMVERGQNDKIETLADGMWWALVTITTVGFGDIYPETGLGRGIAGVLMVSGMFMLALFAGIVGHSLLNAVLTIREDQFRMSTNVNHIVVCGYDAGSAMLLDALVDEIDPSVHDLVVFAPGERPRDLPATWTWVRGDPTKESELSRIRPTHAKAIIVVGTRTRAPAEADAVTILTVFTLRRYMKAQKETPRRRSRLYIVAEILDAENVEHAKTAGANEVIETTRLGFSLMAHAISQPGTAEVLGEVVRTGAHSLYVGAIPAEYELPMTFGALAKALKSHHGVLVIGTRAPDGTDILNPVDDLSVHPGVSLVYLAESDVLSS